MSSIDKEESNNIWDNYKQPEISEFRDRSIRKEWVEAMQKKGVEIINGTDSSKYIIQDEIGQYPGHKANSFELVFDEKYDKPQEINGVTWKAVKKIK